MKPLHRYAVALFSLLLIFVTWDSLVPAIRYAGLAMTAAALGIWLALRIRGGEPFRLPLLALPLALFVALQLSLLSVSLLPQYAIDNVVKSIALLMALLFMVDIFRHGRRVRPVGNALLSLALVFSLLELALAFFWYLRWWAISGTLLSLPPVGYRLSGLLLGHPNVLAGFLNLVLPMATVRLMGSKPIRRRLMWLGMVCLLVVTEFFASSRGAWLGALAGVMTSASLIWLPQLRKQWKILRAEKRVALSPRTMLVVGGLAIGGMAVASLFIWQGLFAPGHAPLSSGRSDIWKPAWQIIRASPILGHGPSSFGVLFAIETQIPPGFSTSHAHNLWLQILSEEGIVGGLLILSAVILAGQSLLNGWRETAGRDMARRRMRLAGYAGVAVALLTHHMLDYLFEATAFAIGALVILALIIDLSPKRSCFEVSRRTFSLCLSVLLVAYIGGSLYAMRGSLGYWEGISRGRARDWEGARHELCRTAKTYPDMTIDAFQCGLASAQVAFARGDEELLDSSIDYWRKGLERDPYWPVHWANVGALEWNAGERAAAVADLEQAMEAAPRNSIFALNLGVMEEASGNERQAVEAYQNALVHDPWLAISGIFDSSPLRQEALKGFDVDDFLDPSSALVVHGLEAQRAGNLASAEGKYLKAIGEDPTNGRGYAFLASLYAEQGRLEEAQEYMGKALFFSPADSLVLHSAYIVNETLGNPDQAQAYLIRAYRQIREVNFSPSYYFGTYHRFFLQTDLVPQLHRAHYTAEMLADFGKMARLLRDEGEVDLADEIFKWLDQQRAFSGSE